MSKVTGRERLPPSLSQKGSVLRSLLREKLPAQRGGRLSVALGGSFLIALELLAPVAGLCRFLALLPRFFGQVCVEKGLGGMPGPGQPLALCPSWLFHSLAELGGGRRLIFGG